MNTPTAMQPSAKPGNLMFFGRESKEWKNLDSASISDVEQNNELKCEVKNNQEALNSMLVNSLQMQHVVVFAGSGTSLGPVGGPSMWNLWDNCVNSNPDSGQAERKQKEDATRVIKTVAYLTNSDGENIEALLSRCEAYLQVKEDDSVATFVKNSKSIILDKCSSFINNDNAQKLEAHQRFLHRLSRRRTRDSRMKLFTTNYDLCFELAAGKQGLVILDGFSFTQPRVFDPRFFLYDIVQKSTPSDETGTPLEGVFQYLKLHGSVNWSRSEQRGIEIQEKPDPENACLIYPAKGKYQQSFLQPHLELISQYLSALRQANTCMVVVGFGFNDDHLSEPILAAVRTNPHLRLIIVDPSAKKKAEAEENKYWKAFAEMSKQGDDIWMINADFQEFTRLIPDLKSLTPSQQLVKDIKQLVGAR